MEKYAVLWRERKKRQIATGRESTNIEIRSLSPDSAVTVDMRRTLLHTHCSALIWTIAGLAAALPNIG
jgi:hypothetical protein